MSRIPPPVFASAGALTSRRNWKQSPTPWLWNRHCNIEKGREAFIDSTPISDCLFLGIKLHFDPDVLIGHHRPGVPAAASGEIRPRSTTNLIWMLLFFFFKGGSANWGPMGSGLGLLTASLFQMIDNIQMLLLLLRRSLRRLGQTWTAVQTEWETPSFL